jgi:hypothetical protein
MQRQDALTAGRGGDGCICGCRPRRWLPFGRRLTNRWAQGFYAVLYAALRSIRAKPCHRRCVFRTHRGGLRPCRPERYLERRLDRGFAQTLRGIIFTSKQKPRRVRAASPMGPRMGPRRQEKILPNSFNDLLELLAEGMRFELTVRLDAVQRFSKPPPSATRPPLRREKQT